MTPEQRALATSIGDRLEEVLPALDAEGIAWLLAQIEAEVDSRPHDERDPWSDLLHRRRPAISLHWATLKGCDGRVERRHGRYVITLQADLAAGKRREVLGHELAHIELDVLFTEADEPEVVHAGEAVVDEHARRRYDRRATTISP